MGIFSKSPAAKERAAFDAAEQRLQAVADKLGQVQQQLAEARSKLAALKPSGDLTGDLDAMAATYAAEHAQLSARIAFMVAAREKLTQELAQARRAVLQAECAIGEALKQHFRAAADDRLKRLAELVGAEVEPLAVELCRASGHHHTRIDWDSVLGALKSAIVDSGKASASFGVGLQYAESATAKIPAAPKSRLLDGDHRAGRHLDRLVAPIDAQSLRRNLQDVSAYLEDQRHALLMLGKNGAEGPKARELQRLIDTAEQSRAELAQQLVDAEDQARLAA